MKNLILTPLGSGNSQYVVRVKSTCDSTGETYENDKAHDFVLKISKRWTIDNHKSRLLFHNHFVQFLNSFDANTYTTVDLNKRKDFQKNLNRQNKVLCILDKNITAKIRHTFMKLLKSSDGSDQVCTEKPENKKILIFYDRNIEKNYSITIPSESIKKLNNNFEFDSSYHTNCFDDDKYELCSIEQNLFNISDFISLNNKLLSNHLVSKNVNRLHTTNNANHIIDELNNYKEILAGEERPEKIPFNNITLELKLKCGLLNFRGIPSLFKMKQAKKRNMKYIFSNGSVVYTSKRGSFFEPCNFFNLEYEQIRTELSKLIDSHQNNMRIFIDKLEVVPNFLKNRSDLLDLISESVMRHKDIFEVILKLQSLAAGQQFIGSLLYCLLHFSIIFTNHISFITNSSLNKRSKTQEQKGDNNPNLIWDDKHFITPNNISGITNILKRSLLYNKFTKCSSYDIQFLFHKYGLKMVFGFYRNILSLMNYAKMSSTCMFYSNEQNLSIFRPHLLKNSHFRSRFRYNSNEYPLYSLLHDLAYHFITFNKEGKEDEKGVDFVVLEDRIIKLIIRTFYTSKLVHRNVTPNYGGNSGIKHVFKMKSLGREFESQLTRLRREQKYLRDWIYLYLCGRVSMDLSAIINIIYTKNTNCNGHCTENGTYLSIKEYKILVDGLSFIDIDLKPITNIFK
uniref:Uncharacterized protein n=1 Tax=Theileria annulata TaxID=5874 RepID=A0A3B0MU66_THEAN